MQPTCWLQDAHQRVFPRGNSPANQAAPPLLAPRGGRLSVQVVLSAEHWPLDAPAQTVTVHAGQAPGVQVRVRRVGFVPVPHHNTATPKDELDGVGHLPGYAPDPLWDDLPVQLPAGETVAYWLSLQIADDCQPGSHTLEVVPSCGDGQLPPLAMTVEVADLLLQPRRDFPVVQWFYCDALLDWYDLTAFEDAFWERLRPYLENVAAHGQDTVYVPVFTPPLDGVKRPTQLLKVSRDQDRGYVFDWTDVQRYVELAAACGIQHFEWTHFFTQWGCAHAIRIYDGQGLDEELLWDPETGATSDTYRQFLAQFLPELKAFLDRHELLERSFFHVSDEPHGAEHLANYKQARAMLRDLAPWMKTMDALSEIDYGREGITDMPIPTIRVTRQYVEEDIPCFTYFCCGPRGRYLNRLLDTPLAKQRMAGWLFWRFQVLGFLHWGYNYWYRSQTRELIDPFTETCGDKWPGWAYGDPFVVYPGPDGPIDSIRWEIFAESLQDYALLQQLAVDPAGELMAPCRDFDDFPKTADWLHAARRQILAPYLADTE